MKSQYFNYIILGILMVCGLLFLSKPVEAAVHGMSPRDGRVTTSTGAPIPYITVTESTDTCMPISYWQQWKPNCPYPYDPSLSGRNHPSCYVERSVRADENGYYYFPPWWPGRHGDTSCDPNVAERYTCSNPIVKIGAVSDNPLANNLFNDLLQNGFTGNIVSKIYAQGNVCTPTPHPTTNITDVITTDLTCNPPPQEPPACGVQCFRNDECAGARDGCTLCMGAVHGDAATGVPSTPGKCGAPPACGARCSKDDDCTGARNGCTSCIAGDDGVKKCAQPPACNVSCTRDDQCAGAKDGCTTCGENDAGTGKVCRKPAACGVSCSKDSQCAGAKDGCTFCTAGKCSAFNPDMCSCDGMDFVAKNAGETFLPGDNVTFVAFGKVPGKDWKGNAETAVKTAEVKSMQFSLYQSKASDPNNAIRIAQSTSITPVVVENSATKVRYKVTWDQKVPASPPPDTIYRVQATLKCGTKAGVLGANDIPGNNNYFTQLYDSVSSMFAKGSVLAATTTPIQRQEQQATTFSPAAQILEKSCTIMRFSFD